MTCFCPKCGGAGWVRRFTIGGNQQPRHCPECGDGAIDSDGFADSDLAMSQLKAQLRPSTTHHVAGD